MKKSIIFLFLLAILCGCTSKFDSTLSLAFGKAQTLTTQSAIVCDQTSRTWRKAIFDNYDHRGQFVSDFNTALYRLHADLEEDGTLDAIRKSKSELNEYAKQLAKHPSSRKDAYDDFIDYVTEVYALADLAVEPEGNLNSYNSNINDIAGRISKARDSFQLKYGDFLTKGKEANKGEDW